MRSFSILASATALLASTEMAASQGPQESASVQMTVTSKLQEGQNHRIIVDLESQPDENGVAQALGTCVVHWMGGSALGRGGDCLLQGKQTGFRALVVGYEDLNKFKLTVAYNNGWGVLSRKYITNPAIDMAQLDMPCVTGLKTALRECKTATLPGAGSEFDEPYKVAAQLVSAGSS